LADLPSVSSNSSSDAAAELPTMLLIDTAGCEFDECQEQDGDSRYNQGEAQAALAHVQRLLAAGLAPADVGIITPYSAQVGRCCAGSNNCRKLHSKGSAGLCSLG
jgi:hypothetical protein